MAKDKRTPEEIENDILEYGTSDLEVIKQMKEALENSYNEMRIKWILDMGYANMICHTYESDKVRAKKVRRFVTERDDIIKNYRKKLEILPYASSMPEMLLREVDEKILTDQLDKKGYEVEKIRRILQDIRGKYAHGKDCLLSCKLDDYEIGDKECVTFKNARARFTSLIKEEYEKAIAEGEDYNLGMSSFIRK